MSQSQGIFSTTQSTIHADCLDTALLAATSRL